MSEIIGTVVLHHSNQLDGRADKKKACICCPDFESHIYAIEFALPEYQPNEFPKHFGKNLDFWLQSNFPFKKLEGRKIRITAELID